jgi:Pyridoxal-dependent decarboxylase conserved domain
MTAIERAIEPTNELVALTEEDADEVRAFVERLDFDTPLEPADALRFAAEGLSRYSVNFHSPRYFGLFEPAPATMGIVAEALIAAYNPQLAAWLASPFAIEAERRVLRAFGSRFGLPDEGTDGTFTSGGAEANHTAVLTALGQSFPELAERGLRRLSAQPVFYVSEEGHPSLLKAARVTGLGATAVRRIPVDERLCLDVEQLRAAIAQDRSAGLAPFMVVATAGTTSAGAIDPLSAVADVAADAQLWLHVDAAWGGGAALVPELRGVLAGIERADSITFDPHKLLSVPIGAGVYLTRHPDVLHAAFSRLGLVRPDGGWGRESVHALAAMVAALHRLEGAAHPRGRRLGRLCDRPEASGRHGRPAPGPAPLQRLAGRERDRPPPRVLRRRRRCGCRRDRPRRQRLAARANLQCHHPSEAAGDPSRDHQPPNQAARRGGTHRGPGQGAGHRRRLSEGRRPEPAAPRGPTYSSRRP